MESTREARPTARAVALGLLVTLACAVALVALWPSSAGGPLPVTLVTAAVSVFAGALVAARRVPDAARTSGLLVWAVAAVAFAFFGAGLFADQASTIATREMADRLLSAGGSSGALPPDGEGIRLLAASAASAASLFWAAALAGLGGALAGAAAGRRLSAAHRPFDGGAALV